MARLRRWLPLVALLALSILAFAAPLMPESRLLFRDHSLVFLPRWQAILDAGAAGQLPSRTLASPGGVPLEATLNGTYTPLTLLLFLGPLKFSYDVFVWAHVALLAAGAYMLTRRLGLSRLAAASVGLVALMGPVLSFENLLVSLIGLAYTPWVLWAFLGLLQRPEAAQIALFGILSGCQLQAIMPETALLDIFGGLLLLSLHPPTRWLRSLLSFLAGAGLGFGLAAIELFPALEAMRSTVRGQGFSLLERSVWSFFPLRGLGLIAPGLFGLPDLPFLLWPQALSDKPSYLNSVYLGGTSWIGLLGLLNRRVPRRIRLALALMGGFGLVMAFGYYTPAHGLVTSLPVLSSARYPVKYLLFLCMALAGLLPLGLEFGLRRPRLLLGALSAHALLVTSAWVALNAGWLQRWMATGIDIAHRLRQIQGLDLAAASNLLHQAQLARMTHALAFAWVLLMCGWLLTRRPRRHQLPAVLVGILGLDLALGATFSIVSLPSSFESGPELRAALKDKRYFRLGPKGMSAPVPVDAGMNPYYRRQYDRSQRVPPPLWGRRVSDSDPDGQSASGSRRAYQLLQGSAGPAAEQLLRRIGVNRVTSWWPRYPWPRVATVRIDKGAPEHIYALPRPRPELAAYDCWTLVPRNIADTELRRLLADPATSDRGVVYRPIADTQPPKEHCLTGTPALVALTSTTSRMGDQVDFSRQSDQPYLAVLLETVSPGWHVYIDGHPAELAEAEAGFVGAFIPGGDHQVRFVYEPLLTEWIPVTLTSLVITLGLLLYGALGGWPGRRGPRPLLRPFPATPFSSSSHTAPSDPYLPHLSLQSAWKFHIGLASNDSTHARSAESLALRTAPVDEHRNKCL